MYICRMAACRLVTSRIFLTTSPKEASLAELEENLRDLYHDLTSGQIPGIRRVTELTLG